MHEVENPEEGKGPENSSEWPFTKKWTQVWRRLEERTRQYPRPHLLLALLQDTFCRLFHFAAFSC